MQRTLKALTAEQKAVRLQACLAESVRHEVLPLDAMKIITRRALDFAGEAPSERVLGEAFEVARKLPRATTVFQILRSWLAGWPTSRRFHAVERRSCAFGCREEDDWRHYLRCPRLWLVVKTSTCPPCPGASPLVRLGFGAVAATRKHEMLQLATACSVYLAATLDEDVAALAREAQRTRDLRALGEQLARCATDAAHGHGGANFARVRRT